MNTPLYLLSFPPKSPPQLGKTDGCLLRCELIICLGYIFNIPLSYPVLIGAVSFPICLGKQIINIVQMINAAKTLVDVDKENRKKTK
ncbi:hypothetical protein PCK2_000253 [Pneumocystis canis]|nr:hypothetical protein PCK2_000253 [Pneumocystis canis]